MGGTLSHGNNQQELVDILVEESYIADPAIEKVFRAVDRAHFFPKSYSDPPDLPYRDVAWRNGHIHISAPCIYSEVLEQLELKPGLSFLNIGSGTGYLSTMVGLILGNNGINHGVEIYEDVVEYANERVKTFTETCSQIDQFEFCSPVFACGNALKLTEDTQYDRIYCGAACTDGPGLDHFKRLLKIGGTLAAPVFSELMLFRRESEDFWTEDAVLPVAFASLLPASNNDTDVPILPRATPKTVKELCRTVIRRELRKKVAHDYPWLCSEKRCRTLNFKPKGDISSSSDSSDDSDWEPEDKSRVKLDSGIVEDIDYSDVSQSDDEEGSISNVSESMPVDDVPTHKGDAFDGHYFSDIMKERIKSLNLPRTIQLYINLERDL